MKFRYFDIHSHLNLSQFDSDKEGVISRMKEEGIGTITVGTDFEKSKIAIELAEKHDHLWATVGLHPNDNMAEIFEFEKYLELAKHPKVVAIGECGLDYFREKNDELKNRQIEIFKKHIEIALEVGKPLMIHARPAKGGMDAYEDVLEILEEYRGKINANFHFFVGDITIAKRALEAGFSMSFDGPITFARDYDEVIRFLPIEAIMAETDAPFASPEPHRGKRCEPWMVSEIVKKIAQIKGLEEAFVAEKLLENTQRVFKISF